MRNHIFWLDTPISQPVSGAEQAPDRCDVAIIGAGFTGLSTACHLARRGVDAVVFEKETLGGGASARTAAMALTGLKLEPEALLKRYGRQQAVDLYRIGLEAVDHLEEFIRREKIDCGFARRGTLWAAGTERHFERLTATRDLLKNVFGHQTEIIPRKALATELAAREYHGALLDPLGGGLNPVKLLNGLASSAVAGGIRLFPSTPVLGITRRNGGFEVRTAAGSTRAGAVVAATNGYTPAFLSYLRRRIIPVGSCIVVTEPLGDELAASLIPRRRVVFDTWHLLHYFRLIEENRLLFGGRVAYRTIDDRRAALRLRQSYRALFPQLGSVEVECHWSGKVAFTFDRMPHAGCMDGIYYAMGYGGHGVALSVLCGRLLAQMILGEPVENPFGRLAFDSRFYYRRTPWFLPLAGAGYHLLDRLDRMRG